MKEPATFDAVTKSGLQIVSKSPRDPSGNNSKINKSNIPLIYQNSQYHNIVKSNKTGKQPVNRNSEYHVGNKTGASEYTDAKLVTDVATHKQLNKMTDYGLR